MKTAFVSLSASVAMSVFSGAYADTLHLTAADRDFAQSACERDADLVPVESDYGYETGEFAIPIYDENGEVNSALVLSADQLSTIPGCESRIEERGFAELADLSDRPIS